MNQIPTALRLLCCVLATLAWTLRAGQEKLPDAPVDLGPELSAARSAWAHAEALNIQIQTALSSGGQELPELQLRQAQAYAEAEAAFAAALDKDSLHPLALASYGRFWLARRDYAAARHYLEAACGSPRAPTAFAPPDAADILRTLGGVLERAGEPRAAVEMYRNALALDPTDPRNRLSLAIALCASGQPHQAAELLKAWRPETTPVAPDYPAQRPATLALGLYTLGLALEQIGFRDEALSAYRRAALTAEVAGATDGSGLHEQARRAVARQEDGLEEVRRRNAERVQENEIRKQKGQPPLPLETENFAQACYLCDQGVKLKELAFSDSSFQEQLALARAAGWQAAAAAQLEQHPAYETFAGALQCFRDSIARYPRFARAYYELAFGQFLLGRFAAARPLLEAAATYSPTDLAVLFLQGEVLLELGQWHEAIAVFRKILILEPAAGRANLGLAKALFAAQSSAAECRAALDALERALQLGVRDRSLAGGQVLVLKDRTELEGTVEQTADGYVLFRGHSEPWHFEAAEVEEVRQAASLREQLLNRLDRYERGEPPPRRAVLRGKARSARSEIIPDPWKGTIFEP